MTDEARSVIFGRDAATYESARPSYPREIIDHVASLVGARDAVEVGAGTGKATAAMARSGLRLTCLEPSPQMAAILESKGCPGVEVIVSTFEDWNGAAGSLDLLYAAQSWHWVDREVGPRKALAVLRPGGAIALFWNIPLDRYGRHRELYERHAPHLLADNDERTSRRDHHDWGEDIARIGFVDVERFSVGWCEEVSAERYRALYSTYSDHMMLDEPTRTRLLDGLADDVESRGGVALVEYRTEVFTGTKPVADQH